MNNYNTKKSVLFCSRATNSFPDFNPDSMTKVLELINYGTTDLSPDDDVIRNGMISIVQCLQINIYLPQATSDKIYIRSQNVEVASPENQEETWDQIHMTSPNMEVVKFGMTSQELAKLSDEPEMTSLGMEYVSDSTELMSQNQEETCNEIQMMSHNMTDKFETFERMDEGIENPNLLEIPERGLTAKPKSTTDNEMNDDNIELPMPYR